LREARLPNEDIKIGPGGGDLASWFGDAGRLAVQRAVHELREGRPVRLTSGDRALIVAAADMLGGARIAALNAASGDAVGLILPRACAILASSCRAPRR
jgi:hypothetical protein